MTITEFLLARIGEDEAFAQACLTQKALTPYSDDRIPPVKAEEWGALVDNYLGGEMGKYCAHNHPLRALAECAAKRALVDLAVTVQEIMEGEWGCGHRVTVDNADEWDRDFEGWEILQTLAAVYKDHPDYQPDWAL